MHAETGSDRLHRGASDLREWRQVLRVDDRLAVCEVMTTYF